MREILFRGKSIDRDEWVYGYYANCSKGDRHFTEHYIIEYPDIYHKVYIDTIGQYTGLKDKNGKKIFEGDILKQYAGTTELGKDLYFFYNVIFDQSAASYGGLEICNNEMCYFVDLEDSEIIGNIYDKTELLRGKTEG